MSEMSAPVLITFADRWVLGMLADNSEHRLGVECFCPCTLGCSAEQEAVQSGCWGVSDLENGLDLLLFPVSYMQTMERNFD